MIEKRKTAGLWLALGCLWLAGCLLLPGKFGSEMTVRGDGTFAFSYKGDIHLVALSKLADEANDRGRSEFVASPCSAEDTGEERPCTDDEIAQQRADWEQSRAASAAKSKEDAETMKTLLGGIDPTDPRAAEEFAARLRRQAGWRSVVDKGDGRFEVDFAIAGRLDHDFAFPTIERMPIASPFVTAIRRADGTVRVEAPGFAASAGGAPMMGMMGAMAKSDPKAQGLPELDGTFTLVTDGEILANNTDEGPRAGTTGKLLSWRVDARTTAPPSALIKLGRSEIRVALALLAAFVAGGARAQDAETILVTGRGLAETPATPAYDVATIERERLAASATGRIEDVLADVAGFQQFRRSDSRSSNPSAQGATLRALGGNATSRALVLLDGVPLADPFFGYVPFSAVAPERLARVRVTRGGGSGAFGAGAVAGTIELESAAAEELGFLDARALVNDRGESEAGATLAPRLGQGFAVVSGRWDRGRGFWTTPAAQRVAASVRAKFDSWSAGVRAVAPLTSSIELQAGARAYDDARTLRFAGADSTSTGQDASVRLVGRGRWAFDALGYVQARDFSNVVISATSFRKTLDQRRTPSTGLGGKFELRPPLGSAHLLRLGADLRIADGELQEEAFSAVTGLVTARRRAGGRNSDLGLYLEDDWSLGRVVLTAGARGDRWSIRQGFFREVNAAGAITADNAFANRAGWDLSLRGGAVLEAGGGLSLRAAGYSGVRVPTLNELYRPFVVFPVTTRANAALENERLRGFEAGLDFAPSPAWRLSLTAFDNRLKDAVANVTIATNLRQRRNVAAIRARGVELGGAARVRMLSFDGSLAWTQAEVEASGSALDGLRPAQTPKLAASATLAWAPRERWRLAATLRHVSRQFEDDLETDALASATTLDGFASVPLSGALSLVLRAENVFDTRVVTRNQGGSIDLGAPRTLWAGVRWGL